MRTCSIAIVLSLAGPAFAQPKPKALPVTGEAQPKLAAIDKLMLEYLAGEKAPGAAVAVTKDGRLVYARGFGFAESEKKNPVQPTSLFRIASVSKALTVAAICQLVERGKLKADDKIWDILKLKEPPEMDQRWKKITVLHLVDHAGGFDRDIDGDPMFRPVEIAKALKISPPPKPDQIVRYMLTRPIEHEPGKKGVYSNFGYCLLGRVIEKVAGKPYEKYVQDELLKPIGVTDMQIGKTLGTVKGEVRYVDPQEPSGPGVFPTTMGRKVPSPYGVWCLESMDSHGGWISSAVDLVRFGSAIDQEDRFPAYKGLAFKYRFCPEYLHYGAISGSCSVLHRMPTGVTLAVLFNSRQASSGKELGADIHDRLKAILNKLESWPEGDLFPKYLK